MANVPPSNGHTGFIGAERGRISQRTTHASNEAALGGSGWARRGSEHHIDESDACLVGYGALAIPAEGWGLSGAVRASGPSGKRWCQRATRGFSPLRGAREAQLEGSHTLAVQTGLRSGVSLLIVAEAISFLPLFSTLSLWSLSPPLGIGQWWPPRGAGAIIPPEPCTFPYTLLLLV